MPDVLDLLHEIRRELMPGPKGPCTKCGQPALRADRCLSCRKYALRRELNCNDDEAERLIAQFVASTRANLAAIHGVMAVRKGRDE